MRRTVQGIAAVLHTRMRGKPVRFGPPGPWPCIDNAPIVYRNARVGEVHALWVEADRVHWIGRLDREQLGFTTESAGPSVPVYEPTVRDLITARRIVGVPALTQARTEREDGCMVLVGWTVARMELLTAQAAPWEGLTLTLR